jgi:hypothetical protein
VRRAGAGEIRGTLAQRTDRPHAVALYGIAPARFDDDPGLRPEAHAFIVDKALWFTVADDLPQYPARIPGQNTPHDSDRPIAAIAR